MRCSGEHDRGPCPVNDGNVSSLPTGVSDEARAHRTPPSWSHAARPTVADPRLPGRHRDQLADHVPVVPHAGKRARLPAAHRAHPARRRPRQLLGSDRRGGGRGPGPADPSTGEVDHLEQQDRRQDHDRDGADPGRARRKQRRGDEDRGGRAAQGRVHRHLPGGHPLAGARAPRPHGRRSAGRGRPGGDGRLRPRQRHGGRAADPPPPNRDRRLLPAGGRATQAGRVGAGLLRPPARGAAGRRSAGDPRAEEGGREIPGQGRRARELKLRSGPPSLLPTSCNKLVAMTAVLARESRLRRFRDGLDDRDRRSLAGMAGLIVLLHVVGFGLLFGVVVPQHFDLGGDHPVFGVGVGVLAYTFGLRHAFDADHIAAVDNTTRKLIADRAEGRTDRRPLSVGFWFSLGHSSVVFALAFVLSLGVKSLAGQVEDGGSGLHTATGMIGASVSGLFLWVLGILNLFALAGILSVFRDMRAGKYDEAALEEHLAKRGFMNRFLGGLTKSVRKAWHIYPVGVLFGLGFDTATEVGLLVMAGGAAVLDLPFYSILVLPVLFAAGMCLMDTIDGVFMNAAYGWAFAKPVRKVFYNITITSISVAVALIIGTVELIGVLADQANITTGPLAAIAGIPLDYAGYGIVGLFVLAWIVALAVWRYGRIEEKWSAHLAE